MKHANGYLWALALGVSLGLTALLWIVLHPLDTPAPGDMRPLVGGGLDAH